MAALVALFPANSMETANSLERESFLEQYPMYFRRPPRAVFQRVFWPINDKSCKRMFNESRTKSNLARQILILLQPMSDHPTRTGTRHGRSWEVGLYLAGLPDQAARPGKDPPSHGKYIALLEERLTLLKFEEKKHFAGAFFSNGRFQVPKGIV